MSNPFPSTSRDESRDAVEMAKVKKRKSILERELEIDMTEKMISPIVSDGANSSRYGRARKSKLAHSPMTPARKQDNPPKKTTKLTSPVRSPGVYRMNASNSPVKMVPHSDPVKDLLSQNQCLSRFSTEKVSPQKQGKIYVRKDLTVNRQSNIGSSYESLSPGSNSKPHNSSHLNTILQRSAEIFSIDDQTSPVKSPQNTVNKTSSELKSMEGKSVEEISEHKSVKKFPSNSKKNLSSHQMNLMQNPSVIKALFSEEGGSRAGGSVPVYCFDAAYEELERSCRFQANDVAWARVGAYPYWPCLITRDPLTGHIVKQKVGNRGSNSVKIMHVSYLADNGRRGWLHESALRHFKGLEEFHRAREAFTPEQKRKDPKLYAAFFVSEKRKLVWDKAVEEAEKLYAEPAITRIDVLYDLVYKEQPKIIEPIVVTKKITKESRNMSLSESLLDTLFSEVTPTVEEKDKIKINLDVSDVVTACLDDMATKTGNRKIQKQSHMDRWLQKAKSKTPEKANENVALMERNNSRSKRRKVGDFDNSLEKSVVPLKKPRKPSKYVLRTDSSSGVGSEDNKINFVDESHKENTEIVSLKLDENCALKSHKTSKKSTDSSSNKVKHIEKTITASTSHNCSLKLFLSDSTENCKENFGDSSVYSNKVNHSSENVNANLDSSMELRLPNDEEIVVLRFPESSFDTSLTEKCNQNSSASNEQSNSDCSKKAELTENISFKENISNTHKDAQDIELTNSNRKLNDTEDKELTFIAVILENSDREDLNVEMVNQTKVDDIEKKSSLAEFSDGVAKYTSLCYEIKDIDAKKSTEQNKKKSEEDNGPIEKADSSFKKFCSENNTGSVIEPSINLEKSMLVTETTSSECDQLLMEPTLQNENDSNNLNKTQFSEETVYHSDNKFVPASNLKNENISNSSASVSHSCNHILSADSDTISKDSTNVLIHDSKIECSNKETVTSQAISNINYQTNVKSQINIMEKSEINKIGPNCEKGFINTHEKDEAEISSQILYNDFTQNLKNKGEIVLNVEELSAAAKEQVNVVHNSQNSKTETKSSQEISEETPREIINDIDKSLKVETNQSKLINKTLPIVEISTEESKEMSNNIFKDNMNNICSSINVENKSVNICNTEKLNGTCTESSNNASYNSGPSDEKTPCDISTEFFAETRCNDKFSLKTNDVLTPSVKISSEFLNRNVDKLGDHVNLKNNLTRTIKKSVDNNCGAQDTEPKHEIVPVTEYRDNLCNSLNLENNNAKIITVESSTESKINSEPNTKTKNNEVYDNRENIELQNTFATDARSPDLVSVENFVPKVEEHHSVDNPTGKEITKHLDNISMKTLELSSSEEEVNNTENSESIIMKSPELSSSEEVNNTENSESNIEGSSKIEIACQRNISNNENTITPKVYSNKHKKQYLQSNIGLDTTTRFSDHNYDFSQETNSIQTISNLASNCNENIKNSEKSLSIETNSSLFNNVESEKEKKFVLKDYKKCESIEKLEKHPDNIYDMVFESEEVLRIETEKINRFMDFLPDIEPNFSTPKSSEESEIDSTELKLKLTKRKYKKRKLRNNSHLNRYSKSVTKDTPLCNDDSNNTNEESGDSNFNNKHVTQKKSLIMNCNPETIIKLEQENESEASINNSINDNLSTLNTHITENTPSSEKTCDAETKTQDVDSEEDIKCKRTTRSSTAAANVHKSTDTVNNLSNDVQATKSSSGNEKEDADISLEEKDFDTSSASDSISTEQEKSKKSKGKLNDPNFVKYASEKESIIMDENPHLSHSEVLTYLYDLWSFTESKLIDEDNEETAVKGSEEISEQRKKKEPRKRVSKQKEKEYCEEKILLKEKPLRNKMTKQNYYEDETDSDSDFISKEDNKSPEKSPEKVVSERSIKVSDGIDVSDHDWFLKELLKPRPNIFKGYTRERICEICELPGDIIKCKGLCGGMYHVDCVKRQTEPKLEVTKKKKKQGRPKKLKTDESSDQQRDDSDSDNKHKKSLISLKCITIDNAEDFESQLADRLKEELDKAEPIDLDLYSTDDELDWSDVAPGACCIVDVTLKPRTELTNDDLSRFKCNDCLKYDTPPCFVCKSVVSPKSGTEERKRCGLQHCFKYYHEECLSCWPQTQFGDGLLCPRHVCHTCVSDDPRGCRTRFSSDKLARCVRCPAVYHSFTRCLPAGSHIINASHIICPRHYQPKTGKVPCHVNTSWCFLCATGGSLICCEFCPMSFHADCLNIQPPEDGYMCEECETGRLPLYGELVWAKLGNYRWWPGVVLPSELVPSNVAALPHARGQFVVRFFGGNDHYWLHRGRVFPYQEGDTGKVSTQKSKIDTEFIVAVEQAQKTYDMLKETRQHCEEENEIASSLLPPRYVKLRVNKPHSSLSTLARRFDSDDEVTTAQCGCPPDSEDPCSPYTQCINRALLTECGPTCRSGERCGNRDFEKRNYPRLAPRLTPHRGWGLHTMQDIRKGQFVIEYVGELIDDAEFRVRMRDKHRTGDENYYFLTLDKDRMIDAGPKGNLARFMNHSCEPNCETQKWTVLGDVRVGLFAIDDIPAGSEVTFNYNLECAGVDKKPCMCGARLCSGYIGAKPKQDERVPKTPKRKYTKKKRSAVPPPAPATPSAPSAPAAPATPATPRTHRREKRDNRPTEIEQDLLIIKNASKGIKSDPESDVKCEVNDCTLSESSGSTENVHKMVKEDSAEENTTENNITEHSNLTDDEKLVNDEKRKGRLTLKIKIPTKSLDKHKIISNVNGDDVKIVDVETKSKDDVCSDEENNKNVIENRKPADTERRELRVSVELKDLHQFKKNFKDEIAKRTKANKGIVTNGNEKRLRVSLTQEDFTKNKTLKSDSIKTDKVSETTLLHDPVVSIEQKDLLKVKSSMSLSSEKEKINSNGIEESKSCLTEKDKKRLPLKRKRVSFSSEPVIVYDSQTDSPSVKKRKTTNVGSLQNAFLKSINM